MEKKKLNSLSGIPNLQDCLALLVDDDDGRKTVAAKKKKKQPQTERAEIEFAALSRSVGFS